MRIEKLEIFVEGKSALKARALPAFCYSASGDGALQLNRRGRLLLRLRKLLPSKSQTVVRSEFGKEHRMESRAGDRWTRPHDY